jgi:hypothetical protein
VEGPVAKPISGLLDAARELALIAFSEGPIHQVEHPGLIVGDQDASRDRQ